MKKIESSGWRRSEDTVEEELEEEEEVWQSTDIRSFTPEIYESVSARQIDGPTENASKILC